MAPLLLEDNDKILVKNITEHASVKEHASVATRVKKLIVVIELSNLITSLEYTIPVSIIKIYLGKSFLHTS